MWGEKNIVCRRGYRGAGALGARGPRVKKKRKRKRKRREGRRRENKGREEIMLVGLSYYNIDYKVFAICRFAVRKKC